MNIDEPIRNIREYWTCREILENAESNNAEANQELAQFIAVMKENVAQFEKRVMSQLFDV